MTFAVAADSYDRFMGRYSVPLAPLFADFADVVAGQRVLDVGCGPGALTTELVGRLGADRRCGRRSLGAVRRRRPRAPSGCPAWNSAPAERLPFADDEFDAALAQLVVHFMADPVAGLSEMARVTRRAASWRRPSGITPAGKGPLSPYWDAVRELDPDVVDESKLAGAREGHLTELFDAAGLREIQETHLEVNVEHPTFEDWWDPFTLGVGPAGDYVARLDPERRAELRERCRERFPTEPFVLTSRAWVARGLAA